MTDSRRRFLHAIVFCACAAAFTAIGVAQEEPLDTQLERTARIKPEAARAFFDALRRNVGQSERAAACGMLAYPLAHATGAVKDVADCTARYDTIFSIPVRRAIGRQRFEEIFVNQSGVMLGAGEVWFTRPCAKAPCAAATEARDLRITALNSDAASQPPPKGKVLLACVVSGQKLRVSADGSGGASLSVWYAPNFTGAPGREFAHAAPPGPPTTCGSRTWVFEDGTRTYTVSELPCDAYLSPPPMGSVGRVALSTSPTPDGEPLWCRDIQD
ncbi:MAG: hypothetical protein QM736_02035 [Vicinamibacterales bacterium]